MALEHFQTQVLLLHSEQSTLDVLSSGFDDRYTVHCATSGIEALNTLGETPIDVIVSAHDLPGMSGLDALREAKKRSPDTIAILMTAADANDGLEAIVSEKEVYQIIRGDIAPEALFDLVEAATKSARLVALSESANDTSAAVDSGPDLSPDDQGGSQDDFEEPGEHIVMETAENGSCVITDATGQLPVLKAEKVVPTPGVVARQVDILALTQDEQFLATIREATVGTHKVHHAVKPGQAEDFVRNFPVGVLVTDAGLAGEQVEAITQRIRGFQQRLVAIVAGRRDDGEMLMDLINRGQVYRFLLKPVSPGRARLAIEASVRYHVEAPEEAFQRRTAQKQGNPSPSGPAAAARPAAVKAAPKQKPRQKGAEAVATPPAAGGSAASPARDSLDDAFDDAPGFTETMTGIAATFGKSIGKAVSGRRAKKESSDRGKDPVNLSQPTAQTQPVAATGPKREPGPVPAEAPQKPAVSAAGVSAGAKAPEPVQKSEPQPEPKPVGDSRPEAPTPRRTEHGKDAVPATGPAARPDAAQGSKGPALLRPALLGVAGAAVLGIGVAAFMMMDGNDPGPAPAAKPAASTPPVAPVAENPLPAPAGTPAVADSATDASTATVDAVTGAPDAAADAMSPQAAALLERARAALADGDVYAPAGQNAVELYLAAQTIDQDSGTISTELQNVIAEVYGLAEAALLEDRNRDASRALRVLGLADADSQRLNFLTRQLNQQQLRVTMDETRVAIREARFEDAGRLLARAETFAGGSTEEIDALSAELETARSAQQLGEVLTLANERLMANLLIEPANDNARYYFALAANIDPSNSAAQQGLLAIASKLVLSARAAIDAGEFDAAEGLLADAEALDPDSTELVAAAAALEAAREAAVSEALSYDDAEPAPAVAGAEAAGEAVASAAPVGASKPPEPAVPATAMATASEADADSPTGDQQAAPVSEDDASPESAAGESAATGGTRDAVLPAAAAAVPVTEAGSNALPAAADTGAPASAESQDTQAEIAAPEPETQTQKVELVSITELERTRYVPPKYPRAAQRRELSGYVDVIFTVSGEGQVADIEIRGSEPGDAFVNAAIDAVEQWEFEPVMEGGLAVPKRVAVRLSFNFQ